MKNTLIIILYILLFPFWVIALIGFVSRTAVNSFNIGWDYVEIVGDKFNDWRTNNG